MTTQYFTGIKSGLLAGIITSIIFSIMISTLIYSTMTNAPENTENARIDNNAIANFFGFGNNFGNISIKDSIINEVVLIMASGVASGILLGIATAAVMSITRKNPSFSASLLIIITLIAYYSQTYGKLDGVISYATLSSDITNDVKFLMVMIYLIPPLVYSAFEGMLLTYFWGIFTVVTIMPAAKILKERPIQTNIAKNAVAPVVPVPPPPKPPQIQTAPKPVLQRTIPDDLKKYIFQCIDKGISIEDIKSMFQGYGYDPKAVDAVIEERDPVRI